VRDRAKEKAKKSFKKKRASFFEAHTWHTLKEF